MLSGVFSLPHLLIILAIILLIFGAPKLPKLAKGITQSMRIFKTELGSDKKKVDAEAEAQAEADRAAATASAAPKV